MLKIEPKKFLFVLILLHLAVALPLAYALNIWVDEASSLYTTQNGFWQTLQNVFADEKQAPLYFLLLGLWRGLNDSVFFARLLSILFSCLAIKFFFDLARGIFDGETAKFVAVLFALHPFLLWSSLDIRVYSFVILLSILLLKFFVEGYLDFQNEPAARRKAQIIFFTISIVALYTNYYLGFILVGNFCALIALKRWKDARFYFLQMILAALAFLPVMMIIRQQFAANTIYFQTEKSFAEGARIIWNHSLNLLFPTEFSPPAEPTLVSITRIWLVRFGIVAAAFLLVKNRFRQIDKNVLALGVIASVVALFLLAAYFLLGDLYVALRHATVLFAPLYLFAGLLLTKIFPRKILAILFVLLAFLFPYSIYKLYPNLTKRGDWARVAAFIEAREKTDQPIIVFQTYDALALPYHYHGANKILPDEKFFAFDAEDSPTSESALQKQTDFVISKIPPDADEIWLVTEDICQAETTKAACRPLENFAQANYTVETEQDFYKEKVRLLRKKK